MVVISTSLTDGGWQLEFFAYTVSDLKASLITVVPPH